MLFLVLTVVAIYLGWHRRLVEIRHSLVARIEAEGGFVASHDEARSRFSLFTSSTGNVGWVRRLMGDVEIRYVSLPATSVADVTDEIEQWLPEARINYVTAFGLTGGPGSVPIQSVDPRAEDFVYP